MAKKTEGASVRDMLRLLAEEDSTILSNPNKACAEVWRFKGAKSIDDIVDLPTASTILRAMTVVKKERGENR